MNCQLYGATCSSSDVPRRPDNAAASGGRKRKRASTTVDQDVQRQPATESLNDAEQPALDNVEQQAPIDVNQRLQTPHQWTLPGDAEILPLVQPNETAPDFDQYALDLGLVLAPFWPPNSPLSLLSNGLETMVDGTSISPYAAHIPTPLLSDIGPSTSAFRGLDLGHTMAADPLASTSQEPVETRPSRVAHELFLRKGTADSKFIGIGSIGSTISECLRYSISTHGGLMESTIIDHLVQGIRHVDELALSTASPLPPLPEREFAERGVQAYFDFLHMLYPIMDLDFLDSWHKVYDGDHQTLSAIAYSRLCLVAAVGNLVSPLSSDSDTWEKAQRLQEKSWTLIDRVMASPFIDSMQIMLLHSVFLLYCGKTGIAWMTCGIAVRIAQSLGLHQHTPSQLGFNAQNIGLRSRLWTVAYTLDAFLSLSEGRPSAIAGTASLASSHRLSEQECPPLATKSPAMDIHEWLVGLAVIANKVLGLLKSGESLSGTLLQIADIDSQLLAWKDAIPMEFRPDQQILADDNTYCLVAMLHLKFHNLMRTVHWISLSFANEQAAGGSHQLQPRVRASESICVTSARSIIEVLNETSNRRIAGGRGGFIVPYCMAAISIFYRQILKEPTRHSTRTNLEYMRNGTLHITNLTESLGPRRHFRALFKDMLRVAEDVVSKSATQLGRQEEARSDT